VPQKHFSYVYSKSSNKSEFSYYRGKNKIKKLFEYFDGQIFELFGFISGHSIKHVVAALGLPLME
jgi:hypothetical protein